MHPLSSTVSTTPIPEWLSNILFTTGDLVALENVVPTALFVIFYGFLSPHRNNFVGRALMRLGVALTITNLVVVASLFLGDNYFGREFVRIFGYAYSGYATWMVYAALLRVQKYRGPIEDLQYTESTLDRKRRHHRERESRIRND